LLAFLASLEECRWRRTHQRHHLGKMLLIVEQTISYRVEQTYAFKQIKDLEQ
jgi:hypothetical protein